jgi:hypothetical protein
MKEANKKEREKKRIEKKMRHLRNTRAQMINF